MSEVSKQIEQMLKDQSLQYTVGKEALSQMLDEIRSLNDLNSELQKDYESIITQVDQLNERVSELTQDLNDAEGELGDYHQREEELKERELACCKIELEAKYSDKFANKLSLTIDQLLRNTQYRQTIHGDKVVPIQGHGEYGGFAHKEENVTETITTEEE